MPLQKTAGDANDTPADQNSEANPDTNPKTKPRERDKPAPSRIGRMPTYGLPAAHGAAVSGFDSLNRRRTQPKR